MIFMGNFFFLIKYIGIGMYEKFFKINFIRLEGEGESFFII